MEAFVSRGKGLKFTSEIPSEDRLQYLDVLVKFEPNHVCWSYSPRAGKPLLNYASDHSRLVKNGIVVACFRAALLKSCCHSVDQAFRLQVSRLQEAGYPLSVLRASCERVLKTLRHNTQVVAEGEQAEDRPKISVIPYVHGLSHRLKKVAQNFEVKVVFSAKNKISSVCPSVKRKFEGKNEVMKVCTIAHKRPFVDCTKNVVYQIPLDKCERVLYIGQTGRCLNIRLMEHASSLKGRPFTHLATHCKECGCTPLFDKTVVLFTHHNQTSREIVEAFHISKHKTKCVSHPSVALLDKEIEMLSCNV